MRINAVILAIFASASVNAHGAMISAVGNADPSVKAQAFGIVATTPRDGSRRSPFQTDSSVIRDREADRNGVCGRTIVGGPNDIAAGMQEAMSSGAVARVRANGGEMSFVIHQVNGDGAGPYSCGFTMDNGKTFLDMPIVTNVPGEKSRSETTATDFPLVARMPSGLPSGAMGFARCRNVANAGPFGGCAPVMIM